MNTPDRIREILTEYDRSQALYERFQTVIEGLLKNLLSIRGYRVHSVTSRLKERQSLLRKLRSDRTYTDLSDITDIVGVRVITHFEDEVDKIGTLIEEEFDVDRTRSIDKRKTLDPDRFGYLSLHYIVRLDSARGHLTENRDLQQLYCEIQVRSILQHAWAEIEHDLGYKARTVPPPIRRRFSRLAGMLEVADVEFTNVRNDLENYENTVIEQLTKTPELICLDAVSLKVFIERDRTLRQIENSMARIYQVPIRRELPSDPFVDRFAALGVNTIKELRDELRAHRSVVLYRWQRLIKTMPRHRALPRGFGLIHLFQVMVAEKLPLDQAADTFRRFFIGDPASAQKLSRELRKDIKDATQPVTHKGKKRQSRAPHR